MDLPLVSIIIPVYNVEAYLVQCLDSIEKQTYKNIECIIVVDGATDGSYAIVKDYCKCHTRCKVYYQENAGSGPARNVGINYSSGEFICFIDPDDWVEVNYVETLIIEQMKGDFDLVISQSIDRKVTQQNKIISTSKKCRPIISYTTQDKCRENFSAIMFEYHYLDGPICKLFRTSLIRNNGIMFPSYRRSQDIVFNFRYYNYINSISTIPVHTYNIRYEYPLESGRGRIFEGYNEIIVKIYMELSEQLKAWNLHTIYETLLHTWVFWYLYAFIYRCANAHIAYDYINNEPYDTIIHKARPSLLVQKIIRFLFSIRAYAVANVLMRLVDKLK